MPRPLTLFLLAGAVCAVAQSLPERRYEVGETDCYEVRVQIEGAPGELVGVSEHEVFEQNGAFLERVRWIRISETSVGDLSQWRGEAPVFVVSLDPAAEIPPATQIANAALRRLTQGRTLGLPSCAATGRLDVGRKTDLKARTRVWSGEP